MRPSIRTIFFLPIIFLIALCSSAPAQEKAEAKFEMTTYYVAFLKRGPNWTAEATSETKKLQEGHMAHITSMAESGKLILAGPFADGGDLRGMFVFRTATLEEAKALAEADPAVRAGRFVLELHPWYSAKGIRIDPDWKE